MKCFKWLVSSFTGLLLVSCVTINIYFPAAAAEKAADKIIEDVWGTQQNNQTDSSAADDKQSAIVPTSQQNLAMGILNWLIPPAEAAGANININSPAINALQSAMKQRHEQLKPYYENGAIGLTENGFITMRDAKVVSLKDRNSVSGLITDENADRKALYAEIAKANGHPEWEADIQQTFAARWVSNAATGWWYQQGGSWKQK
ncbi:hypothetical protein LCGC14_1098430 [marine sediment metagenome]|uniref:DUF1318 domain-containing protein n=1 Tax=marine sediment metagenome TaxID=412755 RepID=A0A0F9MEP9_9ZZZZ